MADRVRGGVKLLALLSGCVVGTHHALIPLRAQEARPLIIETIAGGGIGEGEGALRAALASPSALAVTEEGEILIADTENHRIRKVGRDGVITTIVGTGVNGFAGDDGPPDKAQLWSPRGLAFDANGNLLIADTANHRIRRVERRGDALVITTIAGTGSAGFGGDGGSAKNAQLNGPRGLTVDSAGNIYVADTGNHRIRKIDGSGNISTIAGSGTRGFGGDGGAATSAQLNSPVAVAVSPSGDLFIADAGNHRIRKVSGGTITTVAGTGLPMFSGDGGPAAQASVNVPMHLVFDGAGNLYVADSGNSRVRKIDPSGVITTVAGTSVRGFGGDEGSALEARLNMPVALALGADGTLFIADAGNHRVRAVDPQGVIRTVAGGGIGDGGDPRQAALNLPYGVAVDAQGNLYIADTQHHRIRRVALSAEQPHIETIAGTGISGFNGDDRPAIEAHLNFPRGLAVDAAGNLYIADTFNHRVRKITPDGIITTVAGTGRAGFSGDGDLAVRAELRFPLAVAVDADGRLYIADAGNNRVRRVNLDGTIATIAGTGKRGFEGDDGPAVAAALDTPAALAFDKEGRLLIADMGNHRIRRVDLSSGQITTLAGKGTPGAAGDGGAAKDAELNTPSGLAVDAEGAIFVADSGNHRVRKIGSEGTISAVTGTGTAGFGGDGTLASAATLNFPTGLAIAPDGQLVIADTFNHRVRKLRPQPEKPSEP
ncbi:Serine/threonine-protein kinase PknD [bacterium HR08]|nr:Serine/threonine-protein kinase PknD [bacterium HR08]